MRSLFRNEVEGENRLEIFKKYGVFSGATDYSIYLGNYLHTYDIYGNEYYRNCFDLSQGKYHIISSGSERGGYLAGEFPDLGNKEIWPERPENCERKLVGYADNYPPVYERSTDYMLHDMIREKFSFVDTYAYNDSYNVVNAVGAVEERSNKHSYYDIGIRPVTTLKYLKRITNINWINDEFFLAGEFPSHHIKLIRYKDYNDTEKRNWVNSAVFRNDIWLGPFNMIPVVEKEYRSCTYKINKVRKKSETIKCVILPQAYNGHPEHRLLSDDTPANCCGKMPEYHSFLVEPLEWIYDKKTGLAICAKTIVGGIPYNNMDEYLNKYFVNEIIPSENKGKTLSK